jgi:hypothetical protein
LSLRDRHRPWSRDAHRATTVSRLGLLVHVQGHGFSDQIHELGFVEPAALEDINRPVAFASKPALISRCSSFSVAPLKKLILTWSLKAPSALTIPPCEETAVFHFHSS